MGDNGIDEFDEEELQRRENQMAEEQAIEDFAGGTGSNDGESEEDNPYDLSRQFTGGDEFTGADDFARIGNSGRSDDDDGGDNGVSQGSSYGGYSRGNDYDDERGQEDDEADDSDDFDGDDDSAADEDEQEDDGQREQKNPDDQNEEQAGGAVAKRNADGPIKWKKGDPITLDLLYQVWGECRLMQKIKSLVDAANRTVMEAINTTGPNLALRLNNYLAKFTDSSQDAIGALLDLGKKTGKRLVFIFTSVIEAIFDQQWVQVWLLSTLPKVLETAIATNPLKGILNSIFAVAVPIINKKAQDK